MDGGDPLLYIESIPYWETRGYVPIVLRNYWIYEQKAGSDSAQPQGAGAGHVAALPGPARPAAVRLDAAAGRPRQRRAPDVPIVIRCRRD
jgi:soluble lytic murein transglycosylase